MLAKGQVNIYIYIYQEDIGGIHIFEGLPMASKNVSEMERGGRVIKLQTWI